ncbi:hypothetical protein [Microbulbifer sp. HZ11]|uniref:hypothetical protein n=1 Tax=Microbulbifer sp. HZ11 TaxID=1453501 RepID=UPI0005BCDAC4|nr:hypothetical protein [Microbulbifer sp. HZ11]
MMKTRHVQGPFSAIQSVIDWLNDDDWSLLSEMLEIEAGGEDAGEFVKFAFERFNNQKRRKHLQERIADIDQEDAGLLGGGR